MKRQPGEDSDPPPWWGSMKSELREGNGSENLLEKTT